ncbi:hypothetical protein [Rosenbergiella epipactidis]|uniref:hypothetical protein n=1 Tax=Rosenbergiella epipactidis TaxID=1544694 RepID=UPI001F501D40|nr:hypothetical protein [Rosenbergiella epipactidis]
MRLLTKAKVFLRGETGASWYWHRWKASGELTKQRNEATIDTGIIVRARSQAIWDSIGGMAQVHRIPR